MAQLNVEFSEDKLEVLRLYATKRRAPVDHLIREYVDYLLAGGERVSRGDTVPANGAELAEVAQRGGAFSWLADEPDLYSARDGEPV